MPTYLLHGFRWTRRLIRFHTILNDLDDAAPEWIIAPATSITLLNSFYSLYDFMPASHPPPASYKLPSAPTASIIIEGEREESILLTEYVESKERTSHGSETRSWSKSRLDPSGSTRPAAGQPRREIMPRPAAFNDWSVVKILEQYDPTDEEVVSQPYAFIGDYVIEVGLSISIADEIAKYEQRKGEEETTISHVTAATPAISRATSGKVSPSLSRQDAGTSTESLGWFEKLRDKLDKQAQIGWFVVNCGDEERLVPGLEEEVESFDGESMEDEKPAGLKTPRLGGVKGFFHRKKSGEMR